MSLEIPSYLYPCLTHSATLRPLSTAAETTTTFYLIGVTTESTIQKDKARLDFNSVDLTLINNPTIQLLGSDVDPKHWTALAPRLCAHYSGAAFPNKKGDIKPTRIHIQQFSKEWSFDLNVSVDDGNDGDGGKGNKGGKGGGKGGEVKFEKPKFENKEAVFLSPRQFAIVGQAGENMYAVGMTDSDMSLGTSWRGVTVDATADVNSYLSKPPQFFPSQTTYLAVGTFETSPVAPVIGHITAFEADGSSGQIFPAYSMDKLVQIKSPRPVQMNTITLTSVAIPVHMGLTAFILDKAKDGSVIIYTITPGLSPDLTLIQLSPSSLVPRFDEYMVGTATNTQIIVYSVQENVPRFNSFNMTEKKWSGPALHTQTPLDITFPFPTIPGEGKGNHSDNNGIDSANNTSETSNGAIIGGSIAGGLFLIILVALFFVIQRKRRRNREGHNRKDSLTRRGNASGQSPEGADESIPALSDYQQDLSAPQPHLFESSGPYNTLSSSTRPLRYIPPRPSSAPPQPPIVNQNRAVASPHLHRQQQQQPSHQQQQRRQQQQQPRRGFVVQDIEVISFPSIHEKYKYEQEQEKQRLQREQDLQRSTPSYPYSPVRSFSDSTIYQAHPVGTTVDIASQGNNNGGSTSGRGEDEPYKPPVPFVVAPTPQPHKTEILD